jgi:hypothetical protein
MSHMEPEDIPRSDEQDDRVEQDNQVERDDRETEGQSPLVPPNIPGGDADDAGDQAPGS